MRSFIDKNGNTLLHKAVKENNLRLLYKSALSELNINQQNKDGYSALHYAVKHGDFKMIEAVLQCGVDPLLKTKLSQTASDMAHIGKMPDIVDLIEAYSPGLNQTIAIRDKSKTIDLLKRWVNLANVVRGISSKIFNDSLLSMRLDYYSGQNQFIHYVAADDYERVSSLLQVPGQPLPIDINSIHSSNGTTPLALAIFNSNVKMIDLLLNFGADSRIRLFDGTPLLHYARIINAPFTILITLLNNNEQTWHMRSPHDGLTILFSLAHDPDITAVHIHKILSITQCMALQDRDCNNLDFYDFCKLIQRDDLIEAMWESIAEMMESKSGKLKLINLAIALVGCSVPDHIFQRIYSDKSLENVCKVYDHFMQHVTLLEMEAIELFEAVRHGDLSLVKRHNVADFIDKTGRTALHEAIIHDRYEIAQWLVTERPHLLSIGDTKNRLPLHYAYGVVDSYGKRYVHLLMDMRHGLDQNGLTDMYNNVPSSVKMNVGEELKKIVEN